MVFKKQVMFMVSVINLKRSIKQSTQLLSTKVSSLNSLVSIRTQSLFSFYFFVTKGIWSIFFFCTSIFIRCFAHFEIKFGTLQ